MLAQLLEDTGHADELIPKLETIYKADADNMPLAYFLAQQYVRADQFDKAEPLLRKLIEPAKGRRTLVEAIGSLIEVYRRSKQADLLLDLLGDTIGSGGTAVLMTTEGKALAADEPMTAQLVEAARRRQAAGDNEQAYGRNIGLALLTLGLKQFDTAGEFFEAAIKAEPKRAAQLLLAWGQGLLLANESAAAIKVFQRGVDEKGLADNDPSFLFGLAAALAGAGRTDEAVRTARQAADMQKDSARSLGVLGSIQAHAKRYQDARATYQELLKKYVGVFDSEEARGRAHGADDLVEHRSQ